MFDATDVVSRIDSVEYKIGDGEWTASPGDGVAIEQAGTYAISYRASDVAGNLSREGRIDVTIEGGVAITPAGTLVSTGQDMPVGGAATALLLLLAGTTVVLLRRRNSVS